MKAVKGRKPLDSSIKYDLALAVIKFSTILQENCAEAVYRVTLFERALDECDSGKTLSMNIKISSESGVSSIVTFDINTEEGVPRASRKFYTVGNRDKALANITEALYDFIKALGMCDRPVSSVRFDATKKFKNVYYTEDKLQPGSICLYFEFYSKDYAGLAD